MTMENNLNNQQGGYRPANKEKRPPSFGRVFWGVVFIAAAAAVVLNSLDFLPIHGISIGWFIVLVVMVIILIASIPRLVWFGVFFPLAVIYEIVMNSLGYDTGHFGIWTAFLIALLLSIGFSVLFRRKKSPKAWYGAESCGWTKYDDNPDGHHYEQYEQVFNNPDGAEVFASTRFGSAVKYINTDNLERGLLEISAGNMKVYFDNCKIPSGQAVIELRINAGALEMFIPRTWNILHNYRHQLSGVEEKGLRQFAENAPTLNLVGEVSLSGVTIIYI